MNLVEEYTSWIEFSRIPIKAPVWVAMSIIVAGLVGGLSLVMTFIILHEVTLLPVAFAIATLVLLLGYPYMKTESIIDSIEKNFSDALKQMADTLKAGDTYESALREVANAEYGRLSEEMDSALRRLEEGENLETSLTGFAEKVNSKLVRRTMTIILDSIRTGASLADILDEISDDVRAIERIKEERKSNTTMQFMFMALAGGLIAPAIFGEVNSVMTIFSKVSLKMLATSQLEASQQVTNLILLLIQSYLIIEVVASGAMMSIIREGKLNKSVIYIPLLLLLAFIAYYATRAGTAALIGSAV
ncbi:MAG: type II secretion system F family protein [Candidatus Izemoplasmatales bacterium]